MLRRVISAIVLASLAAAPVVARTRFVCRYTGIEITDCAEQRAAPTPELQAEGCCDRQLTPGASAMLRPSHEEIQPPTVAARSPDTTKAEALSLGFTVSRIDTPGRRAHE